MAMLLPNMYPLLAKKWIKQKSNPTIQTACQKEAYPENFINLNRLTTSQMNLSFANCQPGSKVWMTFKSDRSIFYTPRKAMNEISEAIVQLLVY